MIVWMMMQLCVSIACVMRWWFYFYCMMWFYCIVRWSIWCYMRYILICSYMMSICFNVTNECKMWYDVYVMMQMYVYETWFLCYDVTVYVMSIWSNANVYICDMVSMWWCCIDIWDTTGCLYDVMLWMYAVVTWVLCGDVTIYVMHLAMLFCGFLCFWDVMWCRCIGDLMHWMVHSTNLIMCMTSFYEWYDMLLYALLLWSPNVLYRHKKDMMDRRMVAKEWLRNFSWYRYST